MYLKSCAHSDQDWRVFDNPDRVDNKLQKKRLVKKNPTFYRNAMELILDYGFPYIVVRLHFSLW